MSVDYTYYFNAYKYLIARESAEKQIPVLFQALGEQYTRQASLVSQWMDKMLSIQPSVENRTAKINEAKDNPEVQDFINVLDSTTGYYYSVSAQELGAIVNSDSIDVDSIADSIQVTMSGTKEKVKLASSKILSDVSNTFAELKGQATMYAELAKAKINNINIDAVQSKIQSVLGGLKMPSSVASILEALPNQANLSTVTNVISAHAIEPDFNTWSFDNYEQGTTDSVLGAITELFNDIASGLDKVFSKIKSLSDLFSKLWEAGKRLVTNLVQMAFGWIVNDYEQVDGANFGGADIPLASFKTTIEDFSNMLGQYFVIGGDGNGLVTSKAPVIASAGAYQTVNDGIYQMFTRDRIPYGFNPSAYAYTDGHLSQWVLDIFDKLNNDLLSKDNGMITLFLDGWKICLYHTIDDPENVHIGFFPGGYRFNSYSECEEDGIRDYEHNLSDLTQLVDLNQHIPDGQSNEDVIHYFEDCVSSGFGSSCAMYLHGTTSSKYANAIKDDEAVIMSSAIWNSSAPAWTHYNPKELVQHLRYVDYDFNGELYSNWAQSATGNDRVVLNLFILASRAIVRAYCDTAEHYYGGLAEYSVPIFSYQADGETKYIKVRGLKYETDMPIQKWIPYSTVYDVIHAVHVQTDTERRLEWRKAIIGLLVAAAAVAVTVTFLKAKKKSERKAALRGMQEYNALDAWSADPKNKTLAKNYRKAVKRTKRANKIAAFWGNTPTTVSDFAASDTSIIQNLLSGTPEDQTASLTIEDIKTLING